MKKFYFKAALLLIFIIAAIKIIDQFIVHNELLHHASNKVFKGDDKLDFIVLGNSLSQQSYNSNKLDSIFNSNSMCLGSSAQHFYITNEFLKKIIVSPNSHPEKLLVINISPFQFNNSFNETVKFLQQGALDEVDYSFSYFETISDFYNISEFPKTLSSTLRFHNDIANEIVETKNSLNYLTQSDEDGFVYKIDHELDYDSRVSKKNFKELGARFKELVKNSSSKAIDSRSEEIIINIIEKCRLENINYLFVTPPAIDMVYEQDDYGYFKYLNELLSSQNAPYLNANEYIEELDLTLDDYSDYSHLNLKGNAKFTYFFADYIKKHLKVLPNQENEIKHEKEALQSFEEIFKAQDYNLSKINMNLEPINENFNGQSIFYIERSSVTSSSYLSTKEIDIKSGQKYKASVIIKETDKSDLFALRVQSVYPSRVDAVFDLKNNKFKEVAATEGFTLLDAKMEHLDNGWYKCSIIVKINNGNTVSLIVGPSEINTPTAIWEASTPTKNKTLIIPSSLILEKLQ